MILTLGILAAAIAYWYIGIFTCILLMVGNPMSNREYFGTVISWPLVWFMILRQMIGK